MPLIFDHPQSPPQGYDFIDPSGVRLAAGNLRKLLVAISEFRSVNGMPAGNPEREVESDYAIRHPWLITKTGVTLETAEDPVSRWISRLWRMPPKEKDFAESETTRIRLERCPACPHYAPEHSYDATSARRLTILSHARMTDFSACKAHHWAIGLAALLERPETQVDAEGCWVQPARTGR